VKFGRNRETGQVKKQLKFTTMKEFELGQKVKFDKSAIEHMSDPELINLSMTYEVVFLSPMRIEDVYGHTQRIPKKDFKYLIPA
jgi:hypothetical protein